MNLKLGKLEAKPHLKTLSLAKYLTGVLPTAAEKVYREYKVPAHAKLMYGNDRYGDCTCAAIANLIILFSCHTGTVVIPTLDEVLGLYSAVTGFNPNNPASDNGAAMTDVLAYVQANGFAGEKILGWAAIDFHNRAVRNVARDLFGATYVGVQLPSQAQFQFQAGKPWEVIKHDRIEGGHAIISAGYGSEGDDYTSWANWTQKASAAWSATYIEEEYVVISESWFNAATQRTPGGIDLATLEADLALLK